MTENKESRFGYLFEDNKDQSWYERVFDYIIPFSNTTSKDVKKMLSIYGILNNDLTYIKPYLEALDDPTEGYFKDMDLPDRLNTTPIVYNRLYPKFQYHLGQILNQKAEFDVIPMSDAANDFKEEEWERVTTAYVDRQIENIVSSIQMKEINQDSNVTPNLEEPPNKDSFVSALELFYSDVVRYFFYKFPIRDLWKLSGTHLLCADTAQIGIIENGGEPRPKVFNPIRTGFQKSPDEININKSSVFYETSTVLIDDAYAEVLAYGTKKDLENLENYTSSGYNRPNSKWDIRKGAEVQLDYTATRYGIETSSHQIDRNIGNSTVDNHSRVYNHDNTIYRTYLQFLAWEKVIALTYQNEFGKTVTEFVPKNYTIPKNATLVKDTDKYGKPITKYEWTDEFSSPVSAEVLYIRRRYEGVRYGSDVFIKCREVPFQSEKAEATISISGRIFNSVNAKSVSIVERGINSFLQYTYLKKLQNREMSKYKGMLQTVDASQIPDYLTTQDDGKVIEGVDKITVLEYLERTLGKSLFDSTYNEMGLRNPNQPTASTFTQSAAMAELINIQNLLDLVDREMGLQMLVPPQAEGQYQPYTTNKDNTQALSQAYTMAQTLYDGHTEVWKDAVSEYVSQFRVYYKQYFQDNPDKTEVNLNYISRDQTRQVLKILPEYLDHEDFGFFIRDGRQNEEYRRLMETTGLQALAQNRGEGVEVISTIIKSIVRNDSPEVVHRAIMAAGRKQQEQAAAMQQAMQAKESERTQLDLQKINLQNQGKLENTDLEGQYDLENTKLKATLETDRDGDGIPSDIEVASKIKDDNRKDRELELKEQQFVMQRQRQNNSN